MERCNVQHAIDGLKAVEGFLSTTADLTKKMKCSFALTRLLGGRVALKTAAKPKEGKKVCVFVCVCIYVCACFYINDGCYFIHLLMNLFISACV